MKKLLLLTTLFLISCSPEIKNLDIGDSPTEFTFINNIHSSLPDEWVSEFNEIMGTLKKVIPINSTNYFYELPIYAWNSIVESPFQNKIGTASGASISGNGQAINGKFMVLEIPKEELEGNYMHRLSVICHEYYHAYQMSLSKHFFDGNIELKWMSEGAAATFESLYLQQHYSYGYFEEAQNSVDVAVINSPRIFEKYDTSGDKDSNYSSSVFMFLALSKELQNSGLSEPQVFKLIMKEFWINNPTNDNWKVTFEETFNMRVDDFYDSLKSYDNNINTVIPNKELTLESIYEN
jgi:hypothetical protein